MADKDMLGTVVRKLVDLPAATLGLVYDLLEKLTNPEWVEATKRFLHEENPWPNDSVATVSASLLADRKPVFSLCLGTFGSKKKMTAEVKKRGHKLTHWAKQVIATPNFTLLTEPEACDFFRVRVWELTGGTRRFFTTKELYEGLFRQGFCEAPDESACAIRIAYCSQPKGECLPVLSSPINSSVLCVERNEAGSCVSEFYTLSQDKWWPRNREVLVCRKHE